MATVERVMWFGLGAAIAAALASLGLAGHDLQGSCLAGQALAWLAVALLVIMRDPSPARLGQVLALLGGLPVLAFLATIPFHPTDSLSAGAVLAFMLPTPTLGAVLWAWPRLPGPAVAKALVALGMVLLLWPGACLGIVGGGELAHVFRATHF